VRGLIEQLRLTPLCYNQSTIPELFDEILHLQIVEKRHEEGRMPGARNGAAEA
jgi:hypothetical protein